MLEVRQLSRSYGDFVAVADVNFAIGKGEIVGLLGDNGAGKTTIMKMLSGYLEPDQGSIAVNGFEIASHARQIQQNLGYLPECLPVYPEMSVADYLDYAATLKGLAGAYKVAQIRRAIGATDIGDKLLAPIATLSRGFKQRVGVAQALLGQPELLILDEPTNGLDPTQTDQMRQLIRDIAREATVILSTHIMQEVDALCDRVLILRGGRLVVDARLETLRRSNHLLLDTSMAPENVTGAVGSLAGVVGVERAQARPGEKLPGGRYRITLAQDSDASALCAAIAAAVVNGGHQLYQLRGEHRDLESLFREVSNAHTAPQPQETLNHAA